MCPLHTRSHIIFPTLWTYTLSHQANPYVARIPGHRRCLKATTHRGLLNLIFLKDASGCCLIINLRDITTNNLYWFPQNYTLTLEVKTVVLTLTQNPTTQVRKMLQKFHKFSGIWINHQQIICYDMKKEGLTPPPPLYQWTNIKVLIKLLYDRVQLNMSTLFARSHF